LTRIGALEHKFYNEIELVREKIEKEQSDRRIAKFAQTQAMNEWKKDLDGKRKTEMKKYLEALE